MNDSLMHGGGTLPTLVHPIVTFGSPLDVDPLNPLAVNSTMYTYWPAIVSQYFDGIEDTARPIEIQLMGNRPTRSGSTECKETAEYLRKNYFGQFKNLTITEVDNIFGPAGIILHVSKLIQDDSLSKIKVIQMFTDNLRESITARALSHALICRNVPHIEHECTMKVRGFPREDPSLANNPDRVASNYGKLFEPEVTLATLRQFHEAERCEFAA